MDTTKRKTVISFCNGYGGIEKGLERVYGRLSVLAVSEIEAYAVANTIAKMESGELEKAPLWTNLKTFPGSLFRGKVDLLTGGFPCQPFSAAGARRGTEDPRHLFPYFIKAIRDMRPRRVFLENVAGIMSATIKQDGWADPVGTPVLLHIHRELEREGYRVESGIFSAEEVGAPHQRKRVFILAELADSESWGARFQQVGNGPKFPESRNECGNELADSMHSRGRQDHGPSRPGEEQYAFEPPRAFRDPGKVATQSDLGRDLNGVASELDATPRRMENRADRLRMCGNGVVPQTAERAYRVLDAKLARVATE